jgi:hypothetical protein
MSSTNNTNNMNSMKNSVDNNNYDETLDQLRKDIKSQECITGQECLEAGKGSRRSEWLRSYCRQECIKSQDCLEAGKGSRRSEWLRSYCRQECITSQECLEAGKGSRRSEWLRSYRRGLARRTSLVAEDAIAMGRDNDPERNTLVKKGSWYSVPVPFETVMGDDDELTTISTNNTVDGNYDETLHQLRKDTKSALKSYLTWEHFRDSNSPNGCEATAEISRVEQAEDAILIGSENFSLNDPHLKALIEKGATIKYCPSKKKLSVTGLVLHVRDFDC